LIHSGFKHIEDDGRDFQKASPYLAMGIFIYCIEIFVLEKFSILINFNCRSI
jgi:hypothetical protein